MTTTVFCKGAPPEVISSPTAREITQTSVGTTKGVERWFSGRHSREAITQAPLRLVDIEDSRLPNANLQPPAAAAVAKGLLPASTISGVPLALPL